MSTTKSAPTDDTRHAEVRSNERLTAWAGAALLAGLGAEVLTLLDVHWYMRFHILIGVALFAPLSVKLGSTGYRFFRYYTKDPAYVRKGPPHIVLRLLAPLLVLDGLALLLSGVWLTLTHRLHSLMESVHSTTFWIGLALVGVHLLGYLLPTVRAVFADLTRRDATTREVLRRSGLVIASGVIGLAASAALLPLFYDGR